MRTVPSCKHSRGAVLPQIPLPQHVLEAFRGCEFLSGGSCSCCYRNARQMNFAAYPQAPVLHLRRPGVNSTKFFLTESLLFLPPSYSIGPSAQPSCMGSSLGPTPLNVCWDNARWSLRRTGGKMIYDCSHFASNWSAERCRLNSHTLFGALS